jgi:hypothetical protein
MAADEDKIDGSCCSICETYFKNCVKWLTHRTNDIYTHGYPVACQECYGNPQNKKLVKKLNLQRAVIENTF